MNNVELAKKAKRDINSIIEKLQNYRYKGDINNYKTASDTLSRLVSMEARNSLSGRLDEETYIYYVDRIAKIQAELNALSDYMDAELNKDDLRSYRELLIAYDKNVNSLNIYESYLHSHERANSLTQYRK